jgi:hypothetical protein
VNGIGVYLQTASGGPSITAVDVLTGTIFGSVSNNGQDGPGTGNNGSPNFFYQETSTGAGTVNIVNGTTKFASATFDSIGVAPGQYTYTLDTTFGSTFYTTTSQDLGPTLISGTLTIVPEPQATALIAGALCLVGALVRHSTSRTNRR